MDHSHHDARMLNRRQVLGGGAALAVMAVAPPREAGAAAGYRLTALPAKHRIAADPAGETPVWSYGGTVPGPVIRAVQGERLRIAFENRLEEATTVHWHGLRIPNAMDGVPELTQPPVEPGQQFVYEFVPPDAGTFWYHPHLRSSEQLARGLYGALVVEEPTPPKIDRDLVWVLDDWRLKDDGTINDDFGHRHDISHEGRMGNTVTVNGRRPEDFPVRSGERLRLRLVNSANARTFGLRFDDIAPTVIALDGQPVAPHVPKDRRIVLGAGMRADLIVDMPLKPGGRSILVDDYNEDSKYDLVSFVHAAGTPVRAAPPAMPEGLPSNPMPEPDVAGATVQEVLIEGGSKGFLEKAVYKGESFKARKLWRKHRKIWTLNGVAAHSMKMDPMFTLKRGRSYLWKIKNDTAWDHPMHLHGHSFRVLTRNGKPVPHRPWADTVLLHADETAEVAFVADNPGDWLFHCHILEHHEGGMGAVIRVT